MDSYKYSKEEAYLYMTLLQGVINRMETNSALYKTSCVAFVGIICAVSSSLNKSSILWVAYLITIIFSLIDALYLSLEKGYRDKYIQLSNAFLSDFKISGKPFDLMPNKEYFTIKNLHECYKSWSIWIIYGAICFATLVLHIGL